MVLWAKDKNLNSSKTNELFSSDLIQLPTQDQAEFKNRHRQPDSQKVHTAKWLKNIYKSGYSQTIKASDIHSTVYHGYMKKVQTLQGSFDMHFAVSLSNSVSICCEYDVTFW